MQLQAHIVDNDAGSLISVASTTLGLPHTATLASDADRPPNQQGLSVIPAALTHISSFPKKALQVFSSHGQKVSAALFLMTFCELIDKAGSSAGVELDTEELRKVAAAIFGELAGPVSQRLIDCFSTPVEECIESSVCDAAEMLKGQTCRTDQTIVGNHIVESYVGGTPGMNTLDFVGKGKAVNSSRYAVQCGTTAGFNICRASFPMDALKWAVPTTTPTPTTTPSTTSSTTTTTAVPTTYPTTLKLPSGVLARPYDVTDPEGTKNFLLALLCMVAVMLVGPAVALWYRKRAQPRRYSPTAVERQRDTEAMGISYVGQQAIDAAVVEGASTTGDSVPSAQQEVATV
ncbi:MAG: uncharacterized protein KVP18_000251 [Porospora cf. gigantea A]|uniref:uncharacterized protein n=1 Tax=Porospora cf. gigantea A TaxID=2853593 RepID=UPI00355A1EBF|nr:MAG: hypothetical protein KVP18_000251 [Porospora cf. gigantea A]